MNKLSGLDWVALILVIIGGLNWLLVGLFNFDLVMAIFGEGLVASVVYVLVGLSAVYLLVIAGSLSKKSAMSSNA